MKNRIQIVYGCNDGYFDGLFLSILSVVRRSKSNFEFIVLTGNCTDLNPKFTSLTKKHGAIIDKIIKQYNKNNSIRVIDCTKTYKSKLAKCKNANSRFSPYTCFRLFLNDIKDIDDKVLYLDVDTMANGDVNKIYKTNINDYEFGCVHDASITGRVNPKYFNAGVILFNTKKIKETKLLEKCIKLLNQKKLIFVDQSALYHSATKYKFFDGYWFNWIKPGINNKVVVKHFCRHSWGWPVYDNVKQWEVDKVHKYLKIFAFDEEYKIWKKIIKKEAYVVDPV